MTLSAPARRHRADLAELTRLAENDMRIALRPLDVADDVRDAMLDILPRLMSTYGSAAASLAADWYDDLRESAEVAGRFTAIPAELPDTGRTEALARWAVTPMYAATPDKPTSLVKAIGGLQRIIYNADRDTVTYSSTQDRRARGWQREGVGDCDLCTLLLGRGAVYTESSSQFETHDRCGCIGVPAF